MAEFDDAWFENAVRQIRERQENPGGQQVISPSLSGESMNELARLMHSPQGRRMMFEVLSVLGLYTNPYSHESPHHTAYKCGLQAAGQFIQSLLNKACPHDVFRMMAEAASAEEDAKIRAQEERIDG